MDKQKDISYKGLTDAEVVESRKENGYNVLTTPDRESVLKKFFRKLSDPLIVILFVAGLLSVGISFYEFFGPGEENGNSSVFF